MRKFLVFVAGAVLLFLLYMTVTTSVIVLTFTPAHLKKWLHDGNVYSTVIDSLTKQGQTAVAQTTDGNSNDNGEQVKAAIKQSVTPGFLQASTEQLIDGTTPWLEGKTAQPTFAIDVSGVKQTFIQDLTNQARSRYAALPVCVRGQIPDTSDIFNINCRVAGVSIEPQIQQAIQDFNANQDFLPNATITPDTLNTGDKGQQQPVFDKLHNVPTYYKWAHIAPFILGGLAVLSALVIVFASTEKRKGARRVMIALGTTGIILLITVASSTYGVRKAQDHIAKVASSDSVVQNTTVQVIKLVQHDANTNIIIFAAIFLVLAGGLLAYLLMTRPKRPKAPEADSKPGSTEKIKSEPETPKQTKPPRLVQISA